MTANESSSENDVAAPSLSEEIENALPGIVEGLAKCVDCPAAVSLRSKGLHFPGREAIYEILDDLIALLFPGLGTKIWAGLAPAASDWGELIAAKVR